MTIEQVTPLNSGPDDSFALADKLDLTASQLADLNNGGANYLASFQRANHAVLENNAYTTVTVMGNGARAVTITGMNVVKNCRAPLDGTFFYSPSAGENQTIALGFNLDSQITYAQDTQAGASYGGSFFEEHNVTLSPGEPQTFTIFASTTKHDCTFTIQMHIASSLGNATETIDDNGHPFELTAGLEYVPNPDQASINFSAYQAMYVGGVASDTPATGGSNAWVQVNPKTYDGASDPTLFPPQH